MAGEEQEKTATAIKEDSLNPIIPLTINAIHVVNQEGMALNIIDITAGFRLFESITKKFITGELIITDGVNMLKYYRFTGQEYVRISFQHGTPESDAPIIDKTFRVYKLSRQERPSAVAQTYQLHLCDPTMFVANTTRTSKVYRGSYSDMIRQVFIDDMKQHESLLQIDDGQGAEKTENNQFISPNWKASTLIDYFTEHADSGIKDTAWRNSYFFYQTLGGVDQKESFHFENMDDMCAPDQDIKVLSFYPDASAGEGNRRDLILSVSKPQVFNTIRATATGAYASRSITYDPVRKLDSDEYYNIEESFDRSGAAGHVADGAVVTPLIRGSSVLSEDIERGLSTMDSVNDEVPEVRPMNRWNNQAPNKQHDNFVVYDYNTNHDFDHKSDITSGEVFQGHKVKNSSKLERNGLFEVLEQNRIIAVCSFRTDISVGDIIQLNIPEPERANPSGESNKDKINDDKYLIVDLALTVNLQQAVGGYSGEMQIECVKESYAAKIKKEELEKALKSSAPPSTEDLCG